MHIDLQSRQQNRFRLPGLLMPVSFDVFAFACRQRQHGDRLIAGVDDPIFGNASLGVFDAFGFEVAFGIVGTDDFDDEIGRVSKLFDRCRCVLLMDDENVRFSKLLFAALPPAITKFFLST